MLSLSVALCRYIKFFRILQVNYSTVNLVAFVKEDFAIVCHQKRISRYLNTTTISQHLEMNDLEVTFIQPPENNDVDEAIHKSPKGSGSEAMNEEEVLANISNIVGYPNRTHYETVYSSSSTEDDEPLSKLKPEK